MEPYSIHILWVPILLNIVFMRFIYEVGCTNSLLRKWLFLNNGSILLMKSTIKNSPLMDISFVSSFHSY